MRLNEKLLFAVFGLSLLVAGCGDKSEKVIGFWKSQDNAGGWHSLLEVTKDRMVLDESSSDIAMETKDGKVVIRKAGTDSILAIVTIVDDATLDIEANGKKTRYLKSSGEEHKKLVAASPKEKVVGFWKTASRMDGRMTILEVGREYVSDDGRDPAPLVRAMKDGQLVLEFGESKQLGAPPVVTFIDDDHIEIASPWLGRNVYERMDPDTARNILSPAPELVLGYWKSDNGVLEITRDAVNLNGVVTPVVLRTARKAVVGVDPADNDAVLIRVLLDEKGGIALDAGPMSGTSEYVRATPEEARAQLDAFAKQAAAVVGVWMSETIDQYKRGGRDFMVITPDSYTRNGRTSLVTIRPVSGGVELVSGERFRGTLAELKIIDDTHLETSDGGFISSKSVFVKTTGEVMELLTNPQPGDAEGYWIGENGPSWFPGENAVAVSASSLNLNGIEIPATLLAADGEIRIGDASGKNGIARIRFRDTDSIEMQIPYTRDFKMYRRADRARFDAVLTAYRAGMEKILGFWLSEKEYGGRKGGREIIEIAGDRIVFNDEKYSEYKPAFLNGRIYFTPAGSLDEYYGFIEPLDNGSVNAEFRAINNGVFHRSSKEAVDDLINPKPEKAQGYWVTETKNFAGLPNNLLVLAPGEILINFEKMPVHYASGDGRLIIEKPDRSNTILTIRQVLPDKLVMADNYSTVYVRVTQEELQKALAGYERLFKEQVLGYWKTKQVGGKPSVLLIAPDRVVYNTSPPRQNYKMDIRNGVFRLLPEGSNSLVIEVLGQGAIKYEYNNEFIRIGQEEYEQLLQLRQ